ncbi:hypothetical protein BCR33DRAFT_182404 [Rhizoclosmatium globosum]|uniref:TPR-like protein n=1 Tax=Rhizoclosmatium globosum TaxID=329046 RepID=A0A1Y2D180_9FUNG|nr:hypothetical protein BCR33DRAFT_182404 [Rhizoclosmatium globosum]|eukprot:ORY52957.1 hypothetical protein BCR33DRAFT_182404 [Rhizoclosmatium globosum]
MVQSKSLMASAYTGCKRYGEAETAHYDLMGALGRMGKTDLNYINSCANALVFFVASKQFDRGVELATETSENIKTLEGETFLKKEILKLCAEIFKNASEFQNYDAMLWRLLEFQPATDPEGIKTLQQIGQNRFDVGLYKEAANLWGPLHYACNDKYGENSLEATSIMKKRGDCYYRMGLIEEAYNFYRQAVERQLKGLGEKDLNYRNSVDDLCAIYVKDGQIKMVLDLIEESIRLESLYGSDLPLSKFQKMRKFATLLMNNGSYDPALNLNIRIVADVREELGNSDMLLVETYQELLEISQQTKNSTDILNFSFAVLETSKETFGDESDKALTALRAYAKCECTHGSFDVGIACYNTVIKVQRRVFGTQHIETLTSLHDMGVQYKIKQMYPEADKALSETLSMAMDTFGPRNELTLNTMSDLAGVLNKMDEKVKAEEYYKTVLEMSVDKYGKEHTKTLGALENLIEFYNINGNEQQASDARANFKN